MASPYGAYEQDGQEEEEVAAERELADDAMWKVIQKNTFTRWANENLKPAKLTINDLEKDLSDGLKLISLLECLSGKKFQKYNRRPTFRTQKFENVTMSLKFLEHDEGIRLVNIDSSDIVDNKLKLIMGLIWTLILHYSISMPTWEDEDPSASKDQTPKQRLLAWIQSKIPEKNITNFTSDWNDGTALAALVNALAPGTFPDVPRWNPREALKNAKAAEDAAEDLLDIPQLIKPDEMINPKVDELSMMTYLSRFPNAKRKGGPAPAGGPKAAPAAAAPAAEKVNPARCKAYGPGIEPAGNVVGAPARFVVETAGAGKGDLGVIVTNPRGVPEKCEVVAQNDLTQSYNCVYTPTVEGQYKVTIKFASKDIPKSPYLVQVAGKGGDPTKCYAQGPGIEPKGVKVKRKTYFEVITKGAGPGVVDVGIVDPSGKKDTVKTTITRKSDDVWYVEYTPLVAGLHSVNIFFAGKAIPKSPYAVAVSAETGALLDPSRLPKPVAMTPREAAVASIATPIKAAPGSTAREPEDQPLGAAQVPQAAQAPGTPGDGVKRAWATGRGIQPKGVRVGEQAEFKVHTENAGVTEPKVMIVAPGGAMEKFTTKKVGTTFEYSYKPMKGGTYVITINFDGKGIPKSPFKVEVSPVKQSKVKAYGPGLETGVVNQPAPFTVEPNGEGPIGFKIEGPSQAKIDVQKDPQTGTMEVTYLPTVEGEYAVHVLCNNDDIPKSPFMADIKPLPAGVDPGKVIATGPGLERTGVIVNKQTEFTVDTRQAGKATLEITAYDVDGNKLPVLVTDNKNGTYSCRYTATRSVKYTISIVYGYANVAKSPFKVYVSEIGAAPGAPGAAPGAADASKVKVYGPAVEGPLKPRSPTHFIIDCKEAGPGQPQVLLVDARNMPIAYKTIDNKDRTYRVDFTPVTVGVYTLTVNYTGKPVPGSPFKITVDASAPAPGAGNPAKVKVYGPALEKPVPTNSPTYLIIDCKEAGPGEPMFSMLSDKGQVVKYNLVNNQDRTYKVEFELTVVGSYNANVFFTGKPVTGSPFKITAEAATPASKVKVYGPAVEQPVFAYQSTYLIIDCKEAGDGQPMVNLVNDKNAQVPYKLTDNKDRTYKVEFQATVAGVHTANIFFANRPVPKSPFKINVQPSAGQPVDLSKITVRGLPETVPVNKETPFEIVTGGAGPGVVKATVTAPSGRSFPVVIDQKPDVAGAKFTPTEPGPHTVAVTFNDKPVPNSPFKVTAQAPNPNLVRVYGPALENPVAPYQPTYLIVDCKEAGPGAPAVSLIDTHGKPVPFNVLDQKDQTYRVEFSAVTTGTIVANVVFANQPVPNSPFRVTVQSGVRVYGPAVEGPVAPQQTTYLVIDCKGAGPGQPQVQLTTEQGHPLPGRLTDNGDRTYKVEFEPNVPSGTTLVAAVTYNNAPVPNSPFRIQVSSSAITVKDLPKNVPIGRPVPFSVITAGAGPGQLKVAQVSPSGKITPSPVGPTPEGFVSQVLATEPGPQQVHVTFNDQPVPNSPFTVTAVPEEVLPNVTVKDLPDTIPVGRPVPFNIVTGRAGPGQPKVNILTPQSKLTPAPVGPGPEGFVSQIQATEPGPHEVYISFNDQPIQKSPFRVNAVPDGQTPGAAPTVKDLPKSVPVGRPVPFKVDTAGAGPGQLKVNQVGPSGKVAPSPVGQAPEGFVSQILATEPGPQEVHVTYNDKPVPNSPFKVIALPEGQLPNVTVKDLPQNVPIGKAVPFNVVTAGAGPGQLKVTQVSPSGKVTPSPVGQAPEGFVSQILATEPGPHEVHLTFNDQTVQNSPYKVNAVPDGQTPGAPDQPKVKAYGPGLRGGVAKSPADFTIDTREAGPGALGLTIDGPTKAEIECSEKGPGVYDVRYWPTEPGEYVANILYDDKPIPGSPFRAQVQPAQVIDVSGVKVYGPGVEPGVLLESVTEFTIDAKSVVPKNVGKPKAILTTPTSALQDLPLIDNKDGTYTALYTPFEEGPHKIDVSYNDQVVPKSPFHIQPKPGCDPSKVKAYGPGLQGAQPHKPAKFTISTRGAGSGGIGLSVVGPTEPKVSCSDNQDGTLAVEYLPDSVGDHEIGITFNNTPIPGSPFHVNVTETPVVNPNAVKCYGPGLNPEGVRKGTPGVFTVDTTEAGEAKLDVITTDVINGQRVNNDVVKVKEGVYDVTYVPDFEGPLRVDVTYADQPVPNSPFTTQVQPSTDLSKVTVSGEGVSPTQPLPASIPASFVVDTRRAGVTQQLEVDVKGPQGKPVHTSIQPVGDGTYLVSYTPEDVGPHTVDVKYAGKNLPTGPVRVNAIPTGDANKVKVPVETIKRTLVISEESVITVRKEEAGYGNITATVTSTATTETIETVVTDNLDGTVTIRYTPTRAGVYKIDLKYGGRPVPNGHIEQTVTETTTTAETLQRATVTSQEAPLGQVYVPGVQPSPQEGVPSPYHPTEFNIKVGADFKQTDAIITTPSGVKHRPRIVENPNGTIKVCYQPAEFGQHTLEVFYAGVPVPKSPFTFFVHEKKPGQVSAFGPGLTSGVSGQPTHFTVVTKDAGPGGLGLGIEGPSKAQIQCKDNKDGTATITYTPLTPGDYKITVKFAGQPIQGAPFTAKVTPAEFVPESPVYPQEGFLQAQSVQQQHATAREVTERTSHMSVGRTSVMSLTTTETDLTNLTAIIRSPSGAEEPCLLKRQPTGQLGISFTPRESGDHWVTVLKNGQPIPGSPFKITISGFEVANATKVKVTGQGLVTATTNQVNQFDINTKEAGVGSLGLSVVGPGKVEIKCEENPDGTTRVTYKPTEPGQYQLAVKYADEHVPGSPFTISVGGQGSGRVTESIVRQQQATQTTTSAGSTCELNIKMAGINVRDVEGTVTAPSGTVSRCDVVDKGDNKFTVRFQPTETGVHIVSLKHKSFHIPGSPFQFTVGPIAGGGPHKVKAVGSGLERGEVNKPCPFTIITREAGPGSLSMGIEGPSKAKIDFQDKRDGTSDVTYVVTEPGEYLITVKYNGEQIPDSPFKVFIAPVTGETQKLNVQNLQQQGLSVNTPSQFTVDFNGAQGRLEAKVVAPSGVETEAIVQEVQKDKYAVNFVPKESGVHLVHVKLNGNHVPGSPYPVQVGRQDADAGKVIAYGDGLVRGKTGQICKFIVNTANAGSGALSIGISGPSKVELQSREVEEGYEFSYTPLAPGDYIITIKYAGNAHIPGSPFKAHIEGAGKPAQFAEESRVVVQTVTKTTTTTTTQYAQQQFQQQLQQQQVQQLQQQPQLTGDASKVRATGTGLHQATVNQETTFSIDGSTAGFNMLLMGIAGPTVPCENLTAIHLGRLQYTVKYRLSMPGNYVLVVKWGDQHIPGSPFRIVAQ